MSSAMVTDSLSLSVLPIRRLPAARHTAYLSHTIVRWRRRRRGWLFSSLADKSMICVSLVSALRNERHHRSEGCETTHPERFY